MDEHIDYPRAGITQEYQRIADGCATFLESLLENINPDSLEDSGVEYCNISRSLCAAWRSNAAMASHAYGIFDVVESIARNILDNDNDSEKGEDSKAEPVTPLAIPPELTTTEAIRKMNAIQLTSFAMICARVEFGI